MRCLSGLPAECKPYLTSDFWYYMNVPYRELKSTMAFSNKTHSVKISGEQAKTVCINFGCIGDNEETVRAIQQEAVRAIQECSGMKTLRLKGNGIDVPVAKAIGKALEGQSSLENVELRTVFKYIDDEEKIEALYWMAKGIIRANAKLVTFKFTRNALGPDSIIGLREFFDSSCCLTLQELSLSDNCLGFAGAQRISEYLQQCNKNCLKVGTPMKLKVFEYSINQLGDKGAACISEFLNKLESLESIDLTKNRIGLPGMAALSLAIYSNPSLVELILDDNNLSDGAVSYLARCMQSLQKLQTLSLRQCFLNAGDVRLLAASLRNNCPDIRRIDLSYNKIEAWFDVLLHVMEKKSNFEDLDVAFNPLSPAVEKSLKRRILKLKKKRELSRDDAAAADGSEKVKSNKKYCSGSG